MIPIVGLYCESATLLREIEIAFDTVRLEAFSKDSPVYMAEGCKLQVLQSLTAEKDFWLNQISFFILACKTSGETFALAERLWDRAPSLSVICVARRPEEVFAALPYPFFHVVREFSLEQDLRAVVQKIERAGSLLPKWCVFQGKNELVRVRMKEILYLESDRHQIRVHMEKTTKDRAISGDTDSFLITETLAQCEEKLKPSGFARIHKSFLVNLYHVAKLGKERLVLDCGIQLYISRHRYGEIKFQFENYIRHMNFL